MSTAMFAEILNGIFNLLTIQQKDKKMKIFDSIEKDIAYFIGEFYLQKNNNNYKKANEDIQKMVITNIKYNNFSKTVSISLCRPGILIGFHGENITNLQACLSKEFKESITINIIEDKIIPFLYPCQYDDCSINCDF